MSEEKEYSVIRLCIEKLADLNGSPVRLLNSHPIGGGCINHALKISTSVGDYFLKWNASAPADLFIREAEGMEEMHSFDNPYLQFPKVIWSREVDEQPGFLLIDYLPPATTTSGFDERLGRGIARLHRKTASAYGFYHSNYCGTTPQDNTWTTHWPEFYAQRRIWPLVQKIIALRGMTYGDQKIYEGLVDKMSLPMAGSVRAAGRSLAQIQSDLTARLSPNFAAPPTVFVTLSELGARTAATPRTINIYIVGQATNSGLIAVAPGTTLLQAVAQAGGLSPFAAKKRVQLRRVDRSGVEQVYTFNFDAIERGAAGGGATRLANGDVIVVPQRRLFE
jgi:protein involved in polysaccharide export with SLBB domain